MSQTLPVCPKCLLRHDESPCAMSTASITPLFRDPYIPEIQSRPGWVRERCFELIRFITAVLDKGERPPVDVKDELHEHLTELAGDW